MGKDYNPAVTTKAVVRVTTSNHNTLCAYPNCDSNCHLSCNLPKSMEPADFKYCAVMGNGGKCRVCNHDFSDHFHGNYKWEEQTKTNNVMNADMKAKFDAAKSHVEKRNILKAAIEKDIQDADVSMKSLGDKMAKNIAQLEKLGLSGNYLSVLEAQKVFWAQQVKAYQKEPG